MFREVLIRFGMNRIFLNTEESIMKSGSTMTVHGRVARDFSSSSSFELTATEPTHIDGEVRDLVLTEVPDLVFARQLEPRIVGRFL